MSKNSYSWIIGILVMLGIVAITEHAIGEFILWFGAWGSILFAQYLFIPNMENSPTKNKYAKIATNLFLGLLSISVYRIVWLGASIAFPEWYAHFSDSSLFDSIHVLGILAAISYSQMPKTWYRFLIGVLLIFFYVFAVFKETKSVKTEAAVQNESKTYNILFSETPKFTFEGIGNYSYHIIPDKGSVIVTTPHGREIEIRREGIVEEKGFEKTLSTEDVFGTFVVTPKYGCTSATIILSYW